MLEYERKPAEGAPALEPERVKVIGIGGAGCNVLDRIALHERIDEGELLALNTDIRDLVSSVAQDKIQLGKQLTQGLGAGGDPELGEEAAQEATNEIKESLANFKSEVHSSEEIIDAEFSTIRKNKNYEITPRSHG